MSLDKLFQGTTLPGQPMAGKYMAPPQPMSMGSTLGLGGLAGRGVKGMYIMDLFRTAPFADGTLDEARRLGLLKGLE
tara:strand:+ start:277 stop:507 length:231 start_codon:yes stop_codon:yes gene_type:complete